MSDPAPGPPRPSLRAARRMLGLARAADRRLTTAALVLLVAQAAAVSLLALWLKLFVDSAISDGAGHGRTALLAGLAIAVCIAAVAAANDGSERVRMALTDQIRHLVDLRLLDLVGSTPTLAIQETPAHLRQLELLDAEAWEFGATVPAIMNVLNTMVRVLITVLLLASVTPLLLLLPLFGLPVLALSGRTAGLYRLGNDLAAEPARRAQMLYELAGDEGAAKELRLLRLRAEVQGRFAAEHEQVRRIHVRLNTRGEALGVIGRIPMLAGYLGAIVLVAHRAAAGQASTGDVAMTAVLAGQVLLQVTSSAEQVQALLRTLTSAARYLYLEDVAGPQAHGAATVPARLTSGIQLRAVSYTYPSRGSPTISDLSVTLPAGATVALVGDNGAGKTTLVKLLAGLCTPDHGQILVDGTDLAMLDPVAWRARLSAGFQDHARFEFTLQRAVGVGHLPDLDDADAVQAALESAGTPELTADLPVGLATQLGPAWPGGTDLSGGQWQKLAIGRAMMRASPLLLLLDEPTAAIDAAAEHALFTRWTHAARALRERSGAITVLVSHRFSTVRMADLILVLRDGRICEQGSHDELLAAGGEYAQLFELQARAYR
jgi:ATP-binding cassette, subfamily B, bacterial